MIGKLNYKRLLLLATLPAFMLASCSKEEMGDRPDAQSGEIRFEIGFAPQGDPAVILSDSEGSQPKGEAPATRVTTNTEFVSRWEEGDEIGVFAAPHGTELANSGNYIHNVKLTYTGGTWTGPAYWPTLASGISKLDFYAYYPYNANAANPMSIAFNVHTDQSAATGEKSNYNLSDLLMAKNDNSGSGFDKGETVQLSFTHALAMVQVDVSQSMIGNYDSKALTVWLNGCTTGGVLNLSTQSATQPTNVASPVKMYPCPNDGGAPGIFAYRALVPAQEIDTGTVLFRFEYDGGTLLRSKPLGQPLSLVAGRVAKFDMTFPFTSATVSANVRLTSLFTDEELAQITHLKVMGEMNREDFYTIRDEMDLITNLDLSGATVHENHIPNGGLQDKGGLQKFTFPSNINGIDANAFMGCSGLTGPLIIPDGVIKIDISAFEGCSGFTSLTIPASVIAIENFTFGGCTGLTSITCHIQNPAGGVYYAPDIFEGVSKKIPLYVPKGTLELYKITSPWSDFNDIRPIL